MVIRNNLAHIFSFKSLIGKYLPKTILARFILIIILPIIIAQLLTAYIFYERHWSKVSFYMSSGVISEIKMITEIYQNKKKPDDFLINVLRKNLLLNFEFIPDLKISFNKSKYQEFESSLSSELGLPVKIIYDENSHDILSQIQLRNGILCVTFLKKRIDSPTTYIFIVWMVSAASIFCLMSILFLKNQLKSVSNLADAATEFGKGRSIGNFRPSGALEVRRAGAAFIKMKDRIENQIAQRTEMLAGVSHDLRTPLTRIKLQLAMFNQSEEVIDMQNDLIEMEKMINNYLEFARGEEGEKTQYSNVSEVLNVCVTHYRNRFKNINIEIEKEIYLPIKINSIKRAAYNLLENAAKYSNSIILKSYQNKKNWIIQLEDNGPGIQQSERKKVFDAFYKSDTSRSFSGSTGLGLSITKDIISAHGGKIFLRASEKLGGLKVLIFIPL